MEWDLPLLAEKDCVSSERAAFTDHDVEYNAEAPDVVASAVVRDSLQHLGRSIGRTAAVGTTQLVDGLQPSEAEVGQFDVVVDIQQNVLAFQISTTNAIVNSYVEYSVITAARSKLRKVLSLALSVTFLFVCVRNISGTAERICTKFTRKMCLSLAGSRWNVKVKGQRSRSPGTKTAFFGPFGSLRAVYVW